jgi:hypothetical protein
MAQILEAYSGNLNVVVNALDVGASVSSPITYILDGLPGWDLIYYRTASNVARHLAVRKAIDNSKSNFHLLAI